MRKSGLLSGTSGVMSRGPAPSRLVVRTMAEMVQESVTRHGRLATRRTAEEARRESDKRIVTGAVSRAIAAHGNPVDLIDLYRSGRTWRINLVGWMRHGVGGRVEVDVDVDPGEKCWNTGLDPETVEKAVTRKLDGILRHQAEIGATRGHPRRSTADDVDLGEWRIEAPLLALLRETIGDDAAHLLRAELATRNSFTIRDSRLKPLLDGDPPLDIEVSRGLVRGSFTLRIDEHRTIGWTKGAVHVAGFDLPDTVVRGADAYRGHRLGNLVEHRLLDPEMEITSGTGRHVGTGSGSISRISANVKGFDTAMPEAWCGRGGRQ